MAVCSRHDAFAIQLADIAEKVNKIHGTLVGMNGGGLVQQVEDTETLAKKNHTAIVGMTGIRRFGADLIKMFIPVIAILLSLMIAGKL